MARRTIYVSDLTGKEIDEKDAAQVIIRYADARRGQVVLDVNASEVEEKNIDPNKGVTKFVLPKPTEPSSDYGHLHGSGQSSGSGGLSTAEKGAIVTSDQPLRSERRRGIVPTPPPRPTPAVPRRRPRRAGTLSSELRMKRVDWETGVSPVRQCHCPVTR